MNALSHLDADSLFEARDGATGAVAEHLAACTSCRAEVESLRGALAAMRETPATVPALDSAATDRMIGLALAAVEVPVTRGAPRRWSRPRLALAAAAAVVLVVSVLLGGRNWRADGGESVAVVVSASGGPELFRLAEGGRFEGSEDGALALVVGPMRVASLAGARVTVVRARARNKELLLEAGTVRVEVHGRAPDERIAIRTPHGTIQVTGTVFTVTLSERGMRLAVEEGRTRFVDAAGEVFVSAGGVLTVREGVRTLNPLPQGLATSASPAATEPPPLERIAAAVATATPASPAPDDDDSSYAAAERELRSGHPDVAARLFEEIASGQTAFASIALFELARLRENALADPRGAADAYRRYLALDGPLAPEARLGLCRVSPSDCTP